jgi:triacylglycerol lipase
VTATSRHAILLHGLGRSPRSMRLIERALRAHGYDVHNFGYASRSNGIGALASEVARDIAECAPNAAIDFVTHSLGGILLRVAIAEGLVLASRVRRAVMLAPPSTGSELADVLPGVPVIGRLYTLATGPAGLELGTAPDGLAAQLPDVDFDAGIIAGTRSYNPIFSAILGAPNDGKVRVDRARAAGIRDFLEVPYWHPTLMAAGPVIAQVIYYLDNGRFRR